METRADIEAIYRAEAPRVLATLIRLLGGFDLAEEALHEALVAALSSWPDKGVPDNPRAWLVSAGRFRTIDRLRRNVRLKAATTELALIMDSEAGDGDRTEIADDMLRLLFTCCHPALAPDACAAMALREVCGLTTEAVAAAFLASPATVAQRIVRAKAKIRDAGIPYQVPERPEWPERLESVLQVIYLVFNEGYLSATGPDPLRPDLCAEAIRLGRLLCGLVKEPEAEGLLALMLIHDARRAARLRDRALVPLDRQDQGLWNQDQIAEGRALVTRLLAGHVGTYGVQAAIALEHSAPVTDWARVCGFYDLLLRLDAGPLAELSRAYAVGRRDGPAAGLALVDALAARGGLAGSHLLPATRAELLGRLGRTSEAAEAYREALNMVGTDAERAFLALSLKEMLAR